MLNKATVFHTTQLFADDIRVSVLSLKRSYALADLRDKSGFLMISVKNPLFTRKLVDRYCRFSIEHLDAGLITIVDLPYIRNILASFEDPEARRREIEKLESISGEIRRLVEKVLTGYPSSNVSVVSWNSLVEETPRWLQEEIRAGFRVGGKFYGDIMAQTKKVIRVPGNERNLERFAEFLLEETPVILHLYYLYEARVVDFYPGPPADYFLKLEEGLYADELPEISRIAGKHAGMIYVDFQENKRLVRA
jgi:hypothetical protein